MRKAQADKKTCDSLAIEEFLCSFIIDSLKSFNTPAEKSINIQKKSSSFLIQRKTFGEIGNANDIKKFSLSVIAKWYLTYFLIIMMLPKIYFLVSYGIKFRTSRFFLVFCHQF